MEYMSVPFTAKKLVISIALILLIVSPVSESVSSQKFKLPTCYGKCADLPTDCDAFCRAKMAKGGVCFPPSKFCCCFY
ncbi:hypothetical protein DCAR_0832973 [Daucus carota subsp. sativus]|uniref:Uncharacterized protein n=1 Tax=Daucus carota subsp. sativus TaxID=79200 RepID=A0A175YQB9_DAUCS|nr:hypothetical protein DCAR_0832973 [Daucus carota subsp. sativus]